MTNTKLGDFLFVLSVRESSHLIGIAICASYTKIYDNRNKEFWNLEYLAFEIAFSERVLRAHSKCTKSESESKVVL